MAKELPLREELPESMTWDLSTIFASDEAWEDAFADLEDRLESAEFFAASVTNSATDLYNALQYGLGLMQDLEKLYVYASMKSDQDTANTYYQGLNNMAESLAARVSAAIAFFDPAVLSLSEEELSEFFAAEPKLQDYKHYFDSILTQQGHVLPTEQESLLPRVMSLGHHNVHLVCWTTLIFHLKPLKMKTVKWKRCLTVFTHVCWSQRILKFARMRSKRSTSHTWLWRTRLPH